MTSMVGHDDNVQALRDAASSGRLHHAWLLTGPEGVGKGLFARAAARWLLAEAAGSRPEGGSFSIDPTHPTARLIEAGSHPDLRVVERVTREKTGDQARNISIAQIRALSSLFGATGGLSSRRVAIIDSVDDLEPKAANALLKSLEEPPADGIFVLVSHAPGRLLPTIRSRCRALRFAPLDNDVMAVIVADAMPDATATERDTLVAAGEGSPGRALRFAGLEIVTLDMTIDRLVTEGDPTNTIRSALASSLAPKAAQARYEAFLERAPSRLAQAAKGRSGPALERAVAAWSEARRIASGAVRLSLDPQLTVFEIASLAADLAPSAGQARGRA